MLALPNIHQLSDGTSLMKKAKNMKKWDKNEKWQNEKSRKTLMYVARYA